MFRFSSDDPSVEAGVRRIALEQCDRALASLADHRRTQAEIVHEVRRRAKKLRAVLRLVRPVFRSYDKENDAIREAAGGLSAIRDATVLYEAYDKLRASQGVAGAGAPVGDAIGQALASDRDAQTTGSHVDGSLADFGAALSVVRSRAEDWRLRADGFDALRDGLARTYRSARRLLPEAAASASSAELHDWRKSVKYHLYQMTLLEGAAPALIGATKAMMDKLGERLGEHHNLVVLRHTLEAAPERFGGSGNFVYVVTLVDAQSSRLAAEAVELGRQLFAERPSALARRYRIYWEDWRQHGKKERH